MIRYFHGQNRGVSKQELEHARKWLFKMIFLTVIVAVCFLYIANWLEMDRDVSIKLLTGCLMPDSPDLYSHFCC